MVVIGEKFSIFFQELELIEALLAELSQLTTCGNIQSVLLTGGRSAKALYSQWCVVPEFDHYRSARFYFGDERCVSAEHVDSNYRMAAAAFSDVVHKDYFERIHGEADCPTEEAKRYNQLLPDVIDIVLFSVGEDGHIASLFPYSSVMKSEAKVVYISDSPKSPSERITITPRVILNAKHVIVMAVGNEKGRILAKALSKPQDIDELPVRLTVGRTWVLDKAATSVFQRNAPINKHNTRIVYA